MAIIPGDEKVFMVSNGTNTTYGGSAALQAMNQWYTMQDVADSVESLAAQDLQEVLMVGNTAATPVLINVTAPVPINAIEARSDNGYAIYAESQNEDGVFAVSTNQHALHGTSEYGNGVVGQSANGYGVYAYSTNEDAVNAISVNKTGVLATSTNANAMAAYSSAGYGLYAESITEDGVNTKSNTRHGLNTYSLQGNGVHSVSENGDGVNSYSTNGHAVFAKSAGYSSKPTMRVENDGYVSAIEVTSASGYCISATLGASASSAIYIDGSSTGNSGGAGITSNVTSYSNSIYANNYGSGNGLGAYSQNGFGIQTYGNYGGINATTSGLPGTWGVISDTAAKNGGGVWDAYSDSRVKENVNPYTKGLSEILLINPVTYDYNGLGGIKKSTGHVGVIAQEIKEVLPETVSIYSAKLNEEDEEKTDLHTFNGTALTYALINAIKELKAEIDLLKAK
jgi:hypothetical protein